MQDKKNHRFYAACPWGLEAVLEEELAACGAKRSRKTPSGVMFEGTIETAYLACLRSRIASRVMMEVSFHDYWDSRDIYEQARRTPWELYFTPDQTFRISISAHRAPLKSLEFTTLRIKDAVCDRFRELAGTRLMCRLRRSSMKSTARFTSISPANRSSSAAGEPIRVRLL